MSWRPRVNISWRWIIRGTCLGLLGLCGAMWGLSYVCTVGIFHDRLWYGGLRVDAGILAGFYISSDVMYDSDRPLGWSIQCDAAPPDRPFSLHLLDGDAVGFTVSRRLVAIPLWFPTVLLSLGSWIAWRNTGRGKPTRGFPVEPLASQRESADG